MPGRTSKGVSEPRLAEALLANHTRAHAHHHRRRARHAERHTATRSAQHLGGRAHGVSGSVQWRVQGDAHKSRESRRAPALTAEHYDTHREVAGRTRQLQVRRRGARGARAVRREGDSFCDVAGSQAGDVAGTALHSSDSIADKHLLSFHTVCDGFSHFGLAFTALL